jgi:hypothetical protein
VDLLLNRGANIEEKQRDGMTALLLGIYIMIKKNLMPITPIKIKMKQLMERRCKQLIYWLKEEQSLIK